MLFICVASRWQYNFNFQSGLAWVSCACQFVSQMFYFMQFVIILREWKWDVLHATTEFSVWKEWEEIGVMTGLLLVGAVFHPLCNIKLWWHLLFSSVSSQFVYWYVVAFLKQQRSYSQKEAKMVLLWSSYLLYAYMPLQCIKKSKDLAQWVQVGMRFTPHFEISYFISNGTIYKMMSYTWSTHRVSHNSEGLNVAGVCWRVWMTLYVHSKHLCCFSSIWTPMWHLRWFDVGNYFEDCT